MSDSLFIIAAGFSIVCAAVLMVAYLVAGWIPQRSAFAVTSCVLLSLVLAFIQWWHLQHQLTGLRPLDDLSYRLAVFFAPALFFGFARALVLPASAPTPALLLHLLPGVVALQLPLSIALPVVLCAGTGYALWLSWLVLTTRQQYRQVRIERVFAGLITISAVLVCAAGVFGGESTFYKVYELTIAITYVMVVFALVAIPDFVNELFEQTQMRYAVSTLGEVDVSARLAALELAMTRDHSYRDDSLTLTTLAEQLDLSSHQLSELLNRHLSQSFSQYLRSHRLQAAEVLLLSQPSQSVLSIALETGFRSQSTFYAAFKEAYGISPGAFRSQKGTEQTPE